MDDRVAGKGGGVMKAYVVVINDRHCDPEPVVFSAFVPAVSFARDEAERRASGHGEQCVVEELDTDPTRFLYHATYCIEGDDVWVVETEVRGG